MLPKLFVLLVSLALIHGYGFRLEHPSESDDSNSSSSFSDELNDISGYQIEDVIITRNITEALGLHPNEHVEKLEQRMGDVRGSVFYTLGARVSSKFHFL